MLLELGANSAESFFERLWRLRHLLQIPHAAWVKLHLIIHKLTNRKTDRRQESNLVHFSLKMWHMLAIILMIFPDNQLTNFRGFIGWFRIFIHPPEISMKHRGSSTHRMDAPDTQTDRRTCLFVYVCVLDGVVTLYSHNHLWATGALCYLYSFQLHIFQRFRGWRGSSVVRTTIIGWRTFPALCPIYSWSVAATFWAHCLLWVSQLGHLSLPSLRSRQMRSIYDTSRDH